MFSTKKYKLVNKQPNGLYQIKALRDIPRYGVKKGDLGGFVQGEHNLRHEGDCWVGDKARVSESACVYDSAYVSGSACVYDSAYVSGSACVYDSAHVSGSACVYNSAHVSGSARVYGLAHVYGSAWVLGDMKARTIVQQFDLTPYRVTLTDSHVGVGCQDFTIEELLYGTNLEHALAEGLTRNQYNLLIKLVKEESGR